jgi:hypothetical protein
VPFTGKIALKTDLKIIEKVAAFHNANLRKKTGENTISCGIFYLRTESVVVRHFYLLQPIEPVLAALSRGSRRCLSRRFGAQRHA